MPALNSVREIYSQAVLRLSRAGVASPESEAWQLLEAATGSSRSELISGHRQLDLDQQRLLGQWLARRELREPLQLIVGVSYFYGLVIPLKPGVLIPRPETERLVEITLAELRGVADPLILDVGTGSGAIALALKSERPDARVTASEVDPNMLAAASEAAQALGIEVEFYRSDLLTEPLVGDLARAAQVIVSNPPYLPAGDRNEAQPEVRWDPAAALYAGEDGLAVFRPLLQQAFELLSPGARLIVELDPRNVDLARVEAGAWSSARVEVDLVGRRRFLLLER